MLARMWAEHSVAKRYELRKASLQRTVFFSAPTVEEHWGLRLTAPMVQPDVLAGLYRGSFHRAWYRA